uniref:LRRNT domain-containing protein n=1 Tax=Ditylenchus dipsaci TaxID=166011 RepID=A0A915D5P7_9BILA
MVVKSEEEEDCPKECTCNPTNELECSHLELSRIPPSWPAHYRKIVLKNCSINTIEKNAFRRFQHLQQVHLENCSDLDVIDKFAFKGLQKLRLISIVHNPKLKELYKASFSGIGNQHSLIIHIKHNAIERIRAHTFKNANNLRELIVEDKCFEVESLAFASISKVDFLTVKGACVIEEKAFQNTSRVHNLSILDSSLDIKPKTFAELNHVNQIQLRDNRIGQIEVEAFAGLFTVGTAHLQSNQIGRILRESLPMLKTWVHWSYPTTHCEMRWIQFYEDQALLAENYCGREEAFKALTYYKPLGCPPLQTHIQEDYYQSPPTTSSSHVPPAPPNLL